MEDLLEGLNRWFYDDQGGGAWDMVRASGGESRNPGGPVLCSKWGKTPVKGEKGKRGGHPSKEKTGQLHQPEKKEKG